jgi:hypothetical protein
MRELLGLTVAPQIADWREEAAAPDKTRCGSKIGGTFCRSGGGGGCDGEVYEGAGCEMPLFPQPQPQPQHSMHGPAAVRVLQPLSR